MSVIVIHYYDFYCVLSAVVAGGVAVHQVKSKYDNVTLKLLLKWNSTMPVNSIIGTL